MGADIEDITKGRKESNPSDRSKLSAYWKEAREAIKSGSLFTMTDYSETLNKGFDHFSL
jgi:ribosomal protein S20